MILSAGAGAGDLFKTRTTHVVARFDSLQHEGSTPSASTTLGMGKRFVIRASVSLVLLALPFFSGCATVPRASDSSLSASLLAHRVYFQGSPYLDSSSVARELGGREQWDPQTQVWRLTAGSHDLRLAPQMPVALMDGVPQSLGAPPLMEQDRLLVPEKLWTEHLFRWKAAAPPPLPVVGSRLRVITVDAGHGGRDPGASGRLGLKEKTVTLDVARRLADLLRRDGFQVILTRSDDRFIPLYGRAAIANRAGADLFISVHANASRSRSASGFEAYYLSEATDDNARALEAAENAVLPEEVGNGRAVSSNSEAILWDLLYTEHRAESSELASQICRGMAASSLASKSRGIKSARFAVLKGARMPAVLVEIGFISHPAEESRLRAPDHRQRIAEGIRRGVLAFRNDMERRVASNR